MSIPTFGGESTPVYIPDEFDYRRTYPAANDPSEVYIPTEDAYVLPIASDVTLGGIKVNGGGLLIDSQTGFLSVDGASGGIGDVFGPTYSVDNSIARFNGTNNKTIQDSLATISDIGTISAGADVIAFQTESPTGSYWDNMPWATDTTLGGIIWYSSHFEKVNDTLRIKSGVLSPATHTHAWSDIISGKPTTLSGYGITDAASKVHNLIDTTNHPVTGLTTGHFLKATGATTYGFAAHGLTYSDVGAIADPGTSVDRELLTWNGTGGDAVRVSTGSKIDSNGHILGGYDVIAYSTGSPAGSYWDNLPAATYNVLGHYGGIILGNSNVKFLREDGTWQTVSGAGGGMVYPGAGIPLSTGNGWDTSITNNSANWNTAYSDRMKWDGGSSGLVAATGRTSLGLGTAAQSNTGDFATAGHNHSGTYEPANANIQSHISSTSNPHSVTASQVGLGNVTNESKATMFTNPVFTGSISSSTGALNLNAEYGSGNDAMIHFKQGGYHDWYIKTPAGENPMNFIVDTTILMSLKPNGNVGIGTTAPVGKLTISRAAGTLPLTTTTANSFIQLGTLDYATNGYALITMGYAGSTPNAYQPAYMGYQEVLDDGQTKGDIVFGTRNSTSDVAASERMRIRYDGNVGIGTTSPNYTAANRTTVDINGTSSVMLGFSAGGTGYGYIYTNSDEVKLGTESGVLTLATHAGTARMTILDNGNVGIGTTSPSYPLDVAGRSRIRGSGATGGGLWFSTGAAPTVDDSFVGRSGDSEGQMGFYRSGWKLTINDITSNVGIGIENAPAKLTVNNTDATDWANSINVLHPNLVNGNHGAGIYFGRSRTTDELGVLSFVPSASAQGSKVSIGIWGRNDLLVITGNGTVRAIGDVIAYAT